MKACFISGMLLLTASSYAYNCCDSEPCCEETSCPESYFYVGGDYLYLKAFQEGMDRAGMGPEFIGEIRGIDFKWTNGFRATAGAEFCGDWGVEGTYTYLRPHGKKTTQGERIYPTTLPGFVAGGSNFSTSMGLQFFFDTGEAQYTSIMSTIKLNYDVYDFDLKKLFYCNSCFDGYVSAGVELAYIDEKITDFYTGNLFISLNQFGQPLVTGSAPFEIDWKQSWDFNGVGLRFGGGGSYQICGGFSVVSAIHFAAVFGKYSNKNNRTIPLLDVSNLQDGLGIQSALYQTAFNEYYLVTMTEKYRNFSSNVVLDLGIGWEDCCEKVGFRL